MSVVLLLVDPLDPAGQELSNDHGYNNVVRELARAMVRQDRLRTRDG
jgi:hypothetical protein